MTDTPFRAASIQRKRQWAAAVLFGIRPPEPGPAGPGSEAPPLPPQQPATRIAAGPRTLSPRGDGDFIRMARQHPGRYSN